MFRLTLLRRGRRRHRRAASLATIALRSLSTAANGGLDTALSIAAPAGLAAGDLLVAVIALEFGSRVAAISGFDGRVSEGSLGRGRLQILTRAAGGGEPASYSIDLSDGGGNYASAILLALTGADTADPVRASSAVATAATTAIATGSVTATAGDWAIVGYAVEGSTAAITFTGPAGLTETEHSPESGNAVAAYYGAATAGSASYDGTCSETVDTTGGVILLRPATL